MPRTCIGCDICRDRLDVFDPDLGHATAHASPVAGIRALFKACGGDAGLVFAATSGCDRALPDACAAARLPEPGRFDRRAIASLAGLAPKTRDSGKVRGQRRIGQRRAVVRRLLCMAALSLWRPPGTTTAARRRMQAAGKPAKVILIAMARKIVTIANAVLRDRTPFQPAAQT